MSVEHRYIVVGIPAFNEEAHIRETIQALKAQSWTDFVALISDNASTDRTRDICRDEIAGDSRFHYVRQPQNCGAAGNFNYILDATESPYIMWLGAHDLITPDFLEEHIGVLEEHPEYSLSYSLTKWIDERGAPVRVSNPSNLNRLTGGPISRYLGSIAELGECTAINNVVRRSALGEARFANVAGCDKVVLSTLLYHGPAHLVPKPQYVRREVPHGGTDYMLNMTGRAGVKRDTAGTASLYLANFRTLKLQGGRSFLIHARLRFALERHITRRLSAKRWLSPLLRPLLGRFRRGR